MTCKSHQEATDAPTTVKILNSEFPKNNFKNIFYKLSEAAVSKNDFKVAVMPDFFIDRVIKVQDLSEFVDAIRKKIDVGGGSIRGVSSIDIKGGNAVNVAYCLARLGLKVELFTVADQTGSTVLNSLFQEFSSQVNLHIKPGKHGLTTIFEFANSSYSLSNVMLSDVGDNSNFGPESIDSASTKSLLDSSSAVVLTNWASNLKGTDLMRYIFKNSPNSFHLLDPADIEERRLEFLDDIREHSQLLDLLSVNENEYLQLIDAFSKNNEIGLSDDADNLTILDNICKYVPLIANSFNIQICVHTLKGSVWSDGLSLCYVNSIPPSEIRIVSGAGDSWDSAFLFGHLLGFTIEEKLCFANLYASLYVENLYGDCPSLKDVIGHLKKMALD
jgi:ribokinase